MIDQLHQCPKCNGFVKAGEMLRTPEIGPHYRLECQNCNHSWNLLIAKEIASK